MRPVASLALFALAGCAPSSGKGAFGTLVSGGAWTCLETDADDVTTGGETATYDVTGAVVSDELASGPDGNLLPCGDRTTRVLTLQDTRFATWRLGYVLSDQDGADLTPSLDLDAGETVFLHFSAITSFGEAGGFTLQDTASAIAAMDVGTWGSALKDGDVPGLTVADGEAVAVESRDCGLVTGRSLLFEGDAETELTPVASRLITFGSKAYTAFAIANFDYEGDVSCTDLSGQRIWGVFR